MDYQHTTPQTNRYDEDPAPKRPLSAYNLFFQMERHRLVNDIYKPYTRDEIFAMDLTTTANCDDESGTTPSRKKRSHRKTHGKISFMDLARTIASEWKDMGKAAPQQRQWFEERANAAKAVYAGQLHVWLLRQVPTPQIKKRLGALRRGSLGQFLRKSSPLDPKRSTDVPPVPQKIPPTKPTVSSSSSSSSTAAAAAAATRMTMDSDQSMTVNAALAYHYQMRLAPQTHTTAAARPTTTHLMPVPPVLPPVPITPSDNTNKNTEGRLARLYQMQIQLYRDQMRLQEEMMTDHPQQDHPLRDGRGLFYEPLTVDNDDDHDDDDEDKSLFFATFRPVGHDAPGLPPLADSSEDSFLLQPSQPSEYYEFPPLRDDTTTCDSAAADATLGGPRRSLCRLRREGW